MITTLSNAEPEVGDQVPDTVCPEQLLLPTSEVEVQPIVSSPISKSAGVQPQIPGQAAKDNLTHAH